MDGGDERFERRLVEETSKLRVDAAGAEVRLIERIAQAESGLRHDMGALEVRLGDRIAQSEGALRHEINGLEVRMERALGGLRSDVLKWSFAFWIGQVVALTAIMRALLP